MCPHFDCCVLFIIGIGMGNGRQNKQSKRGHIYLHAYANMYVDHYFQTYLNQLLIAANTIVQIEFN